MSDRNFGNSSALGGLNKPKGTFARDQSGPKLFSMDRTFSASSTDIRLHGGETFDEFDEEEEPSLGKIGGDLASSTRKNMVCQQTFLEDDEFSTGLPSDLPSDMVDIEGNIIGDVNAVQFGLEDDDEEVSSDEDGGHRVVDKHRKTTVTVDLDQVAIVPSSGSPMPMIISDGKLGLGSLPVGFDSIDNNNLGQFPMDVGYPKESRRNSSNRSNIRYTRGPYAPLDRCNSTSASSNNSSTITQHYYPEGGWGYMVLVTALICHALLCGVHLSSGIVSLAVLGRFGIDLRMEAEWLTAFSIGLSLFLSPLWVSICKRKSTRLSSVFGGLVAALGCLFTSFASQFHQLIFSYGILLGVGIGLTRDASFLMVGQYFKRKRELVEIVLVAGSGLGILLMSVSIHTVISSVGWRLGLQAVTGSLFLTFFLGTCYRSASLYHPQRRAILHLKNQKRKIKEKEKRDDKPPFLDFSCLRSRSLQVLVLATGLASFGCMSPLFQMGLECYSAGMEEHLYTLLYVYMGVGWILGCCVFGFLSLQRNEDCRISRKYLCQFSIITCAISMLVLTSVQEYNGLVIFAWVYGLSLGGYQYNLKVYAYEKVRARNFPRAWSFIQSAQGIGISFGVPLAGYMNVHVLERSGYYVSSGAMFLAAILMFLTDRKKRRLFRNKSRNSSMKTCETIDSIQSPQMRRISFAFPDEQISPILSKESRSIGSIGRLGGNSSQDQPALPKELTCISEEGALDTDFQNPYGEKWNEYFSARGVKSMLHKS